MRRYPLPPSPDAPTTGSPTSEATLLPHQRAIIEGMGFDADRVEKTLAEPEMD